MAPTRSTVPVAFIVGTGRCGTTLMAQILNNHRLVCVPPELQILHSYAGNGRRLLEAYEAGDAQRWGAEDFIRNITEMCPYDLRAYLDYPAFFRGLTYPQPSMARLVEQFYQALARHRGKSFLIEQTPWYGQRLDALHELFPDTRILHMVRDGRDVADSFSRTPWWHKSVEKNLARWAREVRSIRRGGRDHYVEESYFEVRYEDLVADPAGTLETITAFLGLPYDPGLLDPSVTDYYRDAKSDLTKFSSPAFNQWREKKQELIFPDSAFAWKKKGPERFRNLDPEVAEVLQELGYPAG